MTVHEDADGHWLAFDAAGRQRGGGWVRKEAAEAVAALPEESVELLHREIEYWREAHRKLVKGVRKAWRKDNPELLLALVYENTGGLMPSPLEFRNLRAAMDAHRKERNDQAQEESRTETD